MQGGYPMPLTRNIAPIVELIQMQSIYGTEMKEYKTNLMSSISHNDSLSPPWEVLVLVAYHLDPKTLAIASCVSKSWYLSMSWDHIWQPICNTYYSSLSNLKITYPLVPYRHLYAMAYVAAKRRIKSLPKPYISLDDLIFAISILHTKDHHPIANIIRLGNEIDHDHNGVFRLNFDVTEEEGLLMSGALENVKITWNVVLKDWRAVFTLMDCEGKIRLAPVVDGWFSEELPSPGCYSSDVMNDIAADLKLVFCKGSGDKVRVDKVSVGILSIVNWRYVTIDDGLRYLQHFLVPSI